MLAQVREVFQWHYRFTQVGAISHSREDNKLVFKVIWFAAFILGGGLTITFLIDIYDNIQKYEVNTSVNVEKRPSLDFPALTVCNKNIIHCQHLFNMIVECEKNSSSCPKRDLYCNMYVRGSCKTTPIKGDHVNSVCQNHEPPEAEKVPAGKFDLEAERVDQFIRWYTELDTSEMEKLSHHPKKFIVGCTLMMLENPGFFNPQPVDFFGF